MTSIRMLVQTAVDQDLHVHDIDVKQPISMLLLIVNCMLTSLRVMF